MRVYNFSSLAAQVTISQLQMLGNFECLNFLECKKEAFFLGKGVLEGLNLSRGSSY